VVLPIVVDRPLADGRGCSRMAMAVRNTRRNGRYVTCGFYAPTRGGWCAAPKPSNGTSSVCVWANCGHQRLLHEDPKMPWNYRHVGYGRRSGWSGTTGGPQPDRTTEDVRSPAKSETGGVVARSQWPLHTGPLEGINNKIKAIKRMAYGFRNEEYFFPGIRSIFPGSS